MNEEQRAAYINAMTACAQIEAMGMVASNQYQIAAGQPPKYVLGHFEELITKYGIHHNQVLETFRS